MPLAADQGLTRIGLKQHYDKGDYVQRYFTRIWP